MEDTWGLAGPPSPASSASEHESGESTGFDDDETGEDRALIDDDDELEQEDLSFCRRVDLEWEEPVPLPAYHREPAPPPPPKNCWRKKPNGGKKTQRLLTDLRRLFTQLVVVGFNSGKYDLNVLKQYPDSLPGQSLGH